MSKTSVSLATGAVLSFYAFFCWLMLKIVLQYIPAGTETGFLGIKQDVVTLPFYLTAFYIHVFSSLLALPAGFTQFSKSILRKFPYVHRLQGRLYIMVIMVLAAPSGFMIGIYANGGLPSRIAFCCLALLWIFFTWQAYSKARQKQFSAHRAFMYRSFALTLSAITLRAWKYLLVGLLHPHPMDVYRIVAWLGWVPNLLLAEYIIYKNRNK